MNTNKKYKQLQELTDNSTLSKNNLANMFNVVNIGKNSYFNLSRSINFLNTDDLLPEAYVTYEICTGDSWTNISYKFYATIELWWLICKFNNIKDPLKMPVPGEYIKIPGDEIKESVLAMLQ